MLHLQKVIRAHVVICHQKKEDYPNVDYHVAVLLMNIVVATKIKQVGLWLDLDQRVSYRYNVQFAISFSTKKCLTGAECLIKNIKNKDAFTRLKQVLMVDTMLQK